MVINTETYMDALKEKQYTAIIRSNEYKQLLKDVAKRIVKKSLSAENEATIENYFDCELFALFKDIFMPLGFSYEPTKEAPINTRIHVKKGKADTLIGALVIEFKQPSTLDNNEKQQKAIQQVSEYISGLDVDTDCIGFVTDGTKGCFVVEDDGKISNEEFSALSGEMLDRLVQIILKVEFKALNSRNLVEDFCKSKDEDDDAKAYKLVKALYKNLSSNTTARTHMLFNEWKELFNLAHDDVSKQQAIIDRRDALESLLDVTFTEMDEEYQALYALQTAYAIIVKIVAYRVASITLYHDSFVNFKQLMEAPSNSLRLSMESLEDGAVFRDYGINNLLEGDFFSWYCTEEQWTAELSVAISGVFEVLAMYVEKSVLNDGSKSSDFFKELYQGMIPPAVRHSLGEYYTKKWIAKQVFDKALELKPKHSWRGLDPCCGSGTFITVMIDKVLEEEHGKSNDEILQAVLNRVQGIDLNPVAVLTARVNYFINIAHLLSPGQKLVIPIFLGDSSYVPEKKSYDGVDCLEYTINTLLEPIDILVPESMVRDHYALSETMTKIELFIKNLDEESTYRCLAYLVRMEELTGKVQSKLRKLAFELVNLEKNNWDGIWARIITNYLTTASMGKFDVIVGNPPWVDWKSLPSGYRERIKSLCISRQLFSGDRVTGGINLNICALISNVVAENWLSEDGIMGFLMPEPLIFQPSYEGYRNLYLSNGERLYFKEFTNWIQAGHPFKPVTQKFLTYFMTKEYVDYKEGVDVEWYILKKGKSYGDFEEINLDEYFDVEDGILATCHSTKNIFSYVNSRGQLHDFMSVAGVSEYIGREGIEFYPQELMIFELSGQPSTTTCTSVRNIQVKKSKYPVPQDTRLLETEYLHPLIKGVDIRPFHVEISGLIVPFPYDDRDKRLPIPITELTENAPQLAKFYQKFKSLILSQTTYNERIIGRKGEFYSLARVGEYSFAENYVVFRDNTKWGAAVVSTVDTTWGGKKRPLFQNHAVSICEDSQGNYITLDEAHFICGIMNAPVSFDYVLHSSDSRSFPIRPRLYIPKYDPENVIHKEIMQLSKKAHIKYDDINYLNRVADKLNMLYLELAKQNR